MNIVNLIEEIANNAHHRIAITDLIRDQSDIIRGAFLTNDSSALRDSFGDQTDILAHRSTIVQINTR